CQFVTEHILPVGRDSVESSRCPRPLRASPYQNERTLFITASAIVSSDDAHHSAGRATKPGPKFLRNDPVPAPARRDAKISAPARHPRPGFSRCPAGNRHAWSKCGHLSASHARCWQPPLDKASLAPPCASLSRSPKISKSPDR